ncbi:hypothetical protein GCM10010916_21110 [Paenibacillus abyssi]|uniref:Uncharacterized protein n=1 Tax=Paenibacillus abyssi TaxID=1340531 RepID=A0A917FUI8_9BACL|nr:hypothetical protein GCM10010916_21110 [Paenibacillus abyssi]
MWFDFLYDFLPLLGSLGLTLTLIRVPLLFEISNDTPIQGIHDRQPPLLSIPKRYFPLGNRKDRRWMASTVSRKESPEDDTDYGASPAFRLNIIAEEGTNDQSFRIRLFKQTCMETNSSVAFTAA